MSTAPPRVSGVEYLGTLNQSDASNRRAAARRLLGELAPYRRQLVVVFILNLLSAGSQAAGPWLISRAIDVNILSGDRSGLSQTMMMLFGVYLLEAFSTRGQIRSMTMIGYRILASFRERLFEHYLHLPIGKLNKGRIGDFISRAINDVASLNSIFTQSIAFLPTYIISLVATLVAMFILSPQLALASFMVIPLMHLSDVYFARQARKAFRDVHAQTGEVTAKLEEDIVGVREAQIFNRIELNIKRFRDRIVKFRKANMQAVGVTSATAPAFDILSTLGTAIVLGYGAYLVINDGLSIGLLAAFLIYVQQFYRPIQLLSQIRTQIQTSVAASERIFNVLDEEREISDPPGAHVFEDMKGAFGFDNVSFAYEVDRPVLHGVTFDVSAGQTVALVGATGAGKTTIANLIPRFENPDLGIVRVDGYDLRKVSLKSLRGNLAIVPQEPFLFSGTVEENIAYGRAGATLEEVQEAARRVEAHSFIEALPKGYQTQLGERGKPLSLGQRQLVSIARAVLADPRILIIDEALSTIDARTEALIQRALDVLFEGRTSVVIAHRLSTVRDSDIILVIDQGRLVETGDHDTLVGRGGRYYEIFQRQFRDPWTEAAAAAPSLQV